MKRKYTKVSATKKSAIIAKVTSGELTQREAALQAGVHVGTIHGWMSKERATEKVQKVSEQLKKQVADHMLEEARKQASDDSVTYQYSFITKPRPTPSKLELLKLKRDVLDARIKFLEARG